MPKSPKRNPISKLPQQDEHWHVLVYLMRTWVPDDDGRLSRPHILLIINVTTDFILATQLYPEPPSPTDVRDQLFEVMMRSEPMMNFTQHRPTLVTAEETAMAEELEKSLLPLDVELRLVERPEMVHDLLQEFNSMPEMGPVVPGLLSVEDATPNLVGDLFAAAADFYRANPWYRLTDEHPLKIELVSKGTKAGGPAFYVIVMGSAGMEYGLSVYQEWAHLLRLFQFAEHVTEIIPESGVHALNYGDITEATFDDIDAIEEYGWEIADEYAYPTPLIFMPNKEVHRPSLEELYWYIAALRAIPVFVDTCLNVDDSGGFKPVDKVLKVNVDGETALVQITYPAGELPPREEWPSVADDWSDAAEDDDESLMPDRRVMEGFMAEAFGEVDDTAEFRAQDIMYQAWEEQNPARRIILAHEALEVSSNCADAYVLLAEEEADTIGRTLEYYELGVAAGKRALGEELFEVALGHFWAVTETRPYMRAREGLATTLWRLGRLDEAEQHMRELLRLNPGDNQGIRYLLLELLVEMEAYDKAQTLIDEYDGDSLAYWMYTKVLLAFRNHGDSKAAQNALDDAFELNTHVPVYLLGQKKIPGALPHHIGIGQENEAQSYAASYISHWRKVPGALDWLQEKTS